MRWDAHGYQHVLLAMGMGWITRAEGEALISEMASWSAFMRAMPPEPEPPLRVRKMTYEELTA
jgi:hypothetical protein